MLFRSVRLEMEKVDVVMGEYGQEEIGERGTSPAMREWRKIGCMEPELRSTAIEPGKILVSPNLLDGPATSGRTLARLSSSRTLEASSIVGLPSAIDAWCHSRFCCCWGEKSQKTKTLGA